MYESGDLAGAPLPDPPYVVETERCHGCATLTAEREQVPESDRDQIRIFLVPRPEEDEPE